MTEEPPDSRELSEHLRKVRDAVDSMRVTRREVVTEEPPDSRELSEDMRECYRLLTEKGVECGLDLDGLLDVCDLTMDDLQVVGQQVNFPPARLGSFEPLWSFTEVERWLGPAD
ncbi:MAG TPA: hypothetical protein VFI59_02250 [Actinomycetota bacterium]|nr:hypothetical protein [Actinomycetota bacterium]